MKVRNAFKSPFFIVAFGFITGTLLFLFTRYMSKGYINRIDSIVAILMLVAGLIVILRFPFKKNYSEKEDKDE